MKKYEVQLQKLITVVVHVESECEEDAEVVAETSIDFDEYPGNNSIGFRSDDSSVEIEGVYFEATVSEPRVTKAIN